LWAAEKVDRYYVVGPSLTIGRKNQKNYNLRGTKVMCYKLNNPSELQLLGQSWVYWLVHRYINNFGVDVVKFRNDGKGSACLPKRHDGFYIRCKFKVDFQYELDILVIGESGVIYYTGDHYQSFQQITW
jgi:hypothetical protein